MESELDTIGSRIQSNVSAISHKVDGEELNKVWSHFQRFAEYKDLKHLHGIVIPEIANFENKIMLQNKKLDQYDAIIRNYDEVIQTKASKMSIDEYKSFAEKNFAKY